MFMRTKKNLPICLVVLALVACHQSFAQGTRLLRQPAISATQIAFEYGGDIWVTAKSGGESRRITSTAAVNK